MAADMLASRDADCEQDHSPSSSNSRDATGVFSKPDNRGTIDDFLDSI